MRWPGWPDRHQFAFVLLHDVESELGQSRCPELMALDGKMGFRSLFSFVAEGYQVSSALRRDLVNNGFEVGIHGLKHDGKLFVSEKSFAKQADRMNGYLKEWESVGFVSPSMQRNLAWMHYLNIEYATSTFDTDPFEPDPEGMRKIFPFIVKGRDGRHQYVELSYTLPQDFTLFVLLKEKTIDIWKKKLDWIAAKGGMALLITHPDYMNYGNGKCAVDEYSVELYREFLEYVQAKYRGRFWNPLPKEISQFWKTTMGAKK
jgi:hypothetical protein